VGGTAATVTNVPTATLVGAGRTPGVPPFGSYVNVTCPGATGVDGGVTVDDGGVVDDEGGALGLGSATTTRVVMLPTRHEPVTGQRRTPEVPSAQSVRRPGVISTVFTPQPLAGLTVTTRDVASGLRDVASQQSRGAGFELDHVTVVPPHWRPGSTRDTSPDESTHTVTGGDAGAATAVEVPTTPRALVTARTRAASARAVRADDQ